MTSISVTAPTGHNTKAQSPYPGFWSHICKSALKVRNTLPQTDFFCYAPSGLVSYFSLSQGWHPGLSCYTPLGLESEAL